MATQEIAGNPGNKKPWKPRKCCQYNTFTDISITPFNNYSVTVPSGGTVTISWDAQ